MDYCGLPGINSLSIYTAKYIMLRSVFHKVFLSFLFFAITLFVPFSLTIQHTLEKGIEKEEKAEDVLSKSEAHKKIIGDTTENIGIFAFYGFFLSFILSLFFARGILRPLKNLSTGVKRIKDGDLDIELPILTVDEFGEITNTFNDMTATLKSYTEDLKKKDLYISYMLDPLWVVDEDNIVTDINPAFTRLLGYERAEAVGRPIYDFFDVENQAIMRHQIEEKREKGISDIYEITIRAKDGSGIPILMSGSPILEGERVIGKIGVLKDFREQKKLRDELREANEYLETIMDSIEDTLIVIDRDFRVVAANQAIYHQAGGKDKAVGQRCYNLTHGLPRPCWPDEEECPVKMVFEAGRTFRTIHEHLTPSGKRFYEILACPIKDERGEVYQVIELMRDVTDRKMLEDDIIQRNKELSAINSIATVLNRSLNQDEIIGEVLNRLIDLFKMDGGGVFLFDESRKELFCVHHKGISDDFVKQIGRVKYGADIPGRVAATGQPITTLDLSKDPRVERGVLKHSGIKGYCCTPVKGKERIIGVFCLFSYKTHIFTPEEERILNSIGDMTGVSLENIKLYDRMRGLYEFLKTRRELEQGLLMRLSDRLVSALNMQEMMDSSVSLAKDSIKADFAWLLMLDAAGNLILGSVRDDTIMGGIHTIIYPKETSSFEAYAIEHGSPIGMAIDEETRFYICPAVKEKGFKSVLAIPLIVGQRALGVLSIYFYSRRDFEEEELHFIQLITGVLALTLERSDLYERMLIEKGMAEIILQSITDGVYTLDKDGCVTSINMAASNILGVSPQQAIGRPCREVISHSDEEFMILCGGECPIGSTLLNEVPSRAELILRRGDKEIPLLVSCSPLLDPKGEPIGAVHVFRDITKEKEIDRMKTDFVRAVSHEFRTPLSAIVGMTEMLLGEEVKGERSKEYLKTIYQEGQRLSHMVSDLLDIAKIERGKIALKEVDIDPVKLIEASVQPFISMAKEKNIELSYNVEDGTPELKGDADFLKQVIINLISNAMIYSDSGAKVWINIKPVDNTVEISVKDTGWGIPEDELPHIFKRFYRGRVKERIKGTGLGLSLCHEIVKLHGGDIRVVSTVGKGSEFTVIIPEER